MPFVIPIILYLIFYKLRKKKKVVASGTSYKGDYAFYHVIRNHDRPIQLVEQSIGTIVIDRGYRSFEFHQGDRLIFSHRGYVRSVNNNYDETFEFYPGARATYFRKQNRIALTIDKVPDGSMAYQYELTGFEDKRAAYLLKVDTGE